MFDEVAPVLAAARSVLNMGYCHPDFAATDLPAHLSVVGAGKGPAHDGEPDTLAAVRASAG